MKTGIPPVRFKNLRISSLMRGKNLVQMDFEKMMKEQGHTIRWVAKGPWDFECTDNNKKYIVKRELYNKIFIPSNVIGALPADTVVAVKGSDWYFTDLKDKKISIQYHKKILRIAVDDGAYAAFKSFASSYPDAEQALIEIMRRAGIYKKVIIYRKSVEYLLLGPTYRRRRRLGIGNYRYRWGIGRKRAVRYILRAGSRWRAWQWW